MTKSKRAWKHFWALGCKHLCWWGELCLAGIHPLQTVLYPNNSWALFGVLRVKWRCWPFPPGRPPGTFSFEDWQQLCSTGTDHPSPLRPKHSPRPSSFTGACIARRTSSRSRRNWYFPLPCAVLEGYFGNKKTHHLVSWIRNICFFVIFIISGIRPN